MKKQTILTALMIAAISSLAGIYRHDTPPDKYKALAAEKQFNCVGMVLSGEDKKHNGSCVLIGKRFVLSAAHVFIEHEYRQDTLYIDKEGKNTPSMVPGGARVVVNNPIKDQPGKAGNYSFRFNDKVYHGKTLRIYPAYLEKSKQFYGDIALIELEEEVTDVTPAIVNRKFDELNTVITGVGFGASGPANRPEDISTYSEKIAGQNTIDKLSGPEINGRPSLLAFDLDHSSREDCNAMGSAKPLPLEYKPGGGDSGGGIFRGSGKKWELIGIVSGGPNSGIDVQKLLATGYYGQVAEQTRVSVFADWIDATIKEIEHTDMNVNIDPK